MPVVDCQSEVRALLQRLSEKATFFVPHIDGCAIGVGSVGSQIITDLCYSFSSEVTGVSFLNIDSMPASEEPVAEKVRARFHHHTVGQPSIGGMIYAGLGEQAALEDDHLRSFLELSGIRPEDPGQTLFLTAAIAGGTGGGVAPILADLGRASNAKASLMAVAISPGPSEADHVHMNAFYAMSRLVKSESASGVDMIVLVNHEKLRQLRGVGRSGEDLRADRVVTHLLRLFQLDLHHSGIIRMCRVSRGMKAQVFVPCVAIGRSMEIFGSLGNVLESAWAYPLAAVQPANVMSSYLLLRVPGRLKKDFSEEVVTEEFEAWNKRHVPAISSSLVQVLHTEEQSDRLDACILLGGDDLAVALRETLDGHRRFKAHVEKSAEWEEYGLSSEKVAAAEQIIQEYDRSMQELRLSKSAV